MIFTEFIKLQKSFVPNWFWYKICTEFILLQNDFVPNTFGTKKPG